MQLTMMVIAKSVKARYIRADCWPPEASANSSASLEERVLAGSSREALASLPLPMTIVIAMVSPNARAKPRMMAPMIPLRAVRRIGPEMASQ